jgi:hypothetical protein
MEVEMRRFTFIACALGVVGCSTANPGRHTNSSNGGTNGSSSSNGSSNGTNGSTTSGTTGSGGDDGGTGPVDPNTNPNCGVMNFALQKGLPPDLLIVLDRSGSMADSPSSGGASKWDQMTAAINQTVTQLQGQIKWGLEMFPHDNDCGVSVSMDVPVAANDAPAISSAIAAQMPGGSTPTADAINAGAKYLSTVADSNPKYMVLATDGEPNCASTTPTTGGTCTCPAPTTQMGSNCCLLGACLPCSTVSAGGDGTADAEAAVTAAATAGVHTFVIGIATDPGADGVLNQMAQNGLEARPGTTQYYPVANQNDLVTAINTIAGQIISCSFAMQQAPPNPDFVEIDVNNAKVPRDTTHMDGWDFGPGDLSIQFYGSYCMSLQSGSVMNVEAIFQCMPVS